MSDETPGAGHNNALPSTPNARPAPDRQTVRLTPVAGGQYVITSQQHGIPTLAQISPGSLSGAQGLTRIISISPSRNQQSSVRPSVANQSIVNVLKSRGNPNIRLQLFPSGDNASSHSRAPKRPIASTIEKKDSYASKLQRVMNHRIVRSKLVKEKYNEHLLELFHLETGGNILDLYQFAKRPKSQAYIAYLKEHSIDPKEHAEEPTNISVPITTPSTPSATSASSLPGISPHQVEKVEPVVTTMTETPSPAPQVKVKASVTPNNQEQIVEKAKQEAYVVQRIADLQKEGLWSEKRLPKIQEMPRTKAHWDYLLEEMVWLAADFAQERKWKKAAAKKCARMVQKYFQDKALAAQRAEKAHEQHLKRIAAFCAKEIKNFWNSVEKLVEYKQNTILEEKRKKALDQQLSFIVDQTEKYSQLLAEGMNKTTVSEAPSALSSKCVSRVQSDDEFDPMAQSDEDDEETIEQEEKLGTAEQTEEVAELQRESQMELDDLLEDDMLRNYLLNRDNIRLSDSEDSGDEEKKTKASEESRKDEEKEKSEEEESEEESEEDESDDEEEEELEKTKESQGHTELKMLVDDNSQGNDASKTSENDDLINDAAAIAESIQPKGNTLSSTTVSTKVPFLLKLPLREYQHIGLDWLVTMYDRKLNGILADEMGLGKTIQTIALLAHLACEKGNWGPHLIVVPTSVMLNWEMEFKKWCPAFKILTYYGTQKERKMKRTGWTKPNAFHVCITSYKLVIQDHQSFRRKKWKYLILDEAQNIKNFKSQRWQLLLNFQTDRRLLLTGTPLQNNLMELWSLMHFLMPNVFQSHREFKEWFSNPVTGMIEGNSEYNENIIKRLHKVLRPFLLRRLKCEVEKQMPKKYEHVVMCRLSKRQRFLYDDYMSRAKTKETLATGNLLSVINVLMQLRKVCNHPNLFEVRPTISPFQCEGITEHIPSMVYSMLEYDPFKHVDLYSMNLLVIMLEIHLGAYQCYRMRQSLRKVVDITPKDPVPPCPPCKLSMKVKMRKDLEEKNCKPPVKSLAAPLQQNVKVKVSGVQLLSQQGIVKTIPVVNISQSGGQVQMGSSIGVTPVLKQSDKINASFAQLVQTSTGKHLLLTSNPNITGNIPVTTTTQGGQKLTLLSKQPVSTIGSTGQPITKAFVKFQLTSVTTATTSTSVTTSNSVVGKEHKVKSVGTEFLGQLYSKQNCLDVRWGENEKDEDDPKGERRRRLELMRRVNERRCSALPLYGRDFQDVVKIYKPNNVDSWAGGYINCLNALYHKNLDVTTEALRNCLHNPESRIEQLKDVCDRFIFYVPAVKAPEPEVRVWHPPPSKYWAINEHKYLMQRLFSRPATSLHHIASAMVTQFPDPRLIQYDCGKLQTMDRLLRTLKSGGHRVLIFTQMTRMLDVLEAFLNFHGHIYLRLDGTTKIEQRQVLMERFNGDPRIFAFILSTRSGGVGVNLTGADTVIFYDSDWNPTMDAQAQDRCHRIGQTRDVHIYRLVSERTIEENILKKANQKRLLGDLAIEGGNFTTAYFKSSTIQDLFNVDTSEESASNRMSDLVESRKEREKALAGPSETETTDDKAAVGALESALAAAEDEQDVAAAHTAKAEAVADLAEFDESVPLETDNDKQEPEISKAEQEINSVMDKLSPIEKYAMKFIEETETVWSAEQLRAAEQEIEKQKLEWERNRLQAMKEEEERRQRELVEESELLTYSREDATNQIWVSENTMEQMPMWCPPTPPQQETDVYVDHALGFLYDTQIMTEEQLPSAAASASCGRRDLKRPRSEATGGTGTPDPARRPAKIPRRDDGGVSASAATAPPRSLFHAPALLRMRRDARLQRSRGLLPVAAARGGGVAHQRPPAADPPAPAHEWTLHEDMAILKVIQGLQGLPANLLVMNPGHTPNWDFVADYVNTVSITYRSPKQCRQRFETVLMAREEGRLPGGGLLPSIDPSLRKKKKALSNGSGMGATRPARTAQLYSHDNNNTFSRIMNERYDALKSISCKRIPTSRVTTTIATTSSGGSPHSLRTKQTSHVLSECGIDLDHPVLPVEVAARRAERIAKEKKMTPEQMAKLQLLRASQQQLQNQAQSTSSTGQTVSSVANLPASTSLAASQAAQSVSAATVVVSSLAGSTPSTPPSGTIRTQRIIASPIQTSAVVSVSGLSPAQLQAATQRLIVSAGGTATQAKTIAASSVAGKQLGQVAQIQMLRQAGLKQQLRLHTASGAGRAAVAGAGSAQAAVVQLAQAQNQKSQLLRAKAAAAAAAAASSSGQTVAARTVSDSEMAQLIRKQHQLQQQQKLQQQAQQQAAQSGATATTVQGLPQQVFAQAIQQAQQAAAAAGTSTGQSVATLVKAVNNTAISQTVTIPVTGVTLAAAGAKTLTSTLKTTNPQQLRQLQIQQQLMAQKKLAGSISGQKLSIAQVAAGTSTGAKTGNMQTTQVIYGGAKPLSVQQFQQVIRSPLGVSQGSVVLAKGPPRVIPVNTAQGTKQTIQVVAATPQGLRPQSASTTLAGALAGIKVQGGQQALLSQVTAALGNQAAAAGVSLRQGSPVRIQTASGSTPLVAVSVQSQQQQQQSPQANAEQVSRFARK